MLRREEYCGMQSFSEVVYVLMYHISSTWLLFEENQIVQMQWLLQQETRTWMMTVAQLHICIYYYVMISPCLIQQHPEIGFQLERNRKQFSVAIFPPFKACIKIPNGPKLGSALGIFGFELQRKRVCIIRIQKCAEIVRGGKQMPFRNTILLLCGPGAYILQAWLWQQKYISREYVSIMRELWKKVSKCIQSFSLV